MRLQPLDCPGCGAALAAASNDVVVYCTACRNGYLLPSWAPGAAATEAAPGTAPADLPAAGAPGAAPPSAGAPAAHPARAGLTPVAVRFVATPAGVAAARHLPFWLLPARVAIHERRASGAMIAGLLAAFLGGGETAGGDGGAYFCVPAFDLPIATTLELTLRYSGGLPGLGELLGERLLGASLEPADAEKLAHYALLAAEARKPDTLLALRYSVAFGPACLLGVPFAVRPEGLVDAMFGIAVPVPPG